MHFHIILNILKHLTALPNYPFFFPCTPIFVYSLQEKLEKRQFMMAVRVLHPHVHGIDL